MEEFLLPMASIGWLTVITLAILILWFLKHLVKEIISFRGGGLMLMVFLLMVGWMIFLAFRAAS